MAQEQQCGANLFIKNLVVGVLVSAGGRLYALHSPERFTKMDPISK